ncbi:hypothetical protein DL93DRAFT_2055855 [Clavulina sp. PMI_390]|nr:hypothetical protein DL93DRAFT_2055855 [Clavulina sp. PMI_390]
MSAEPAPPFTDADLEQFKATFNELGYVILPSPLLLSQRDLIALREASARAIAKTRSGEWTRRRVVGKQFPPFDTDEERPDAWGVQHVMHPDLGESEFVRWYGSERLVKVMAHFLGCEETEVQMELFNLLINPEKHEFALRWHRDDVHEGASEEEEDTILHASHWGIQWNTALYEDECLYVVPRSHLIVSTPEQRALSTTEAIPPNPLQMPGSIQVKLNPGDTVIYNNNILHTGKYDPTKQRATLHGCMGNTRGGHERARMILQHDVRWMRSAEFGQTLQLQPQATEADGLTQEEVEKESTRLVGMWELLLKMEKEGGEFGSLGFSHK